VGPSPNQQAAAWLNIQAREWAPLLIRYGPAELDALRDEVAQLPRLDLSLQLPLPALLSPALEHLRRVVATGDVDAIRPAAAQALPTLDRPTRRAQLARAVLALHSDDHRIDCDVAAYAVIDLADGDPPVLLSAALVQSIIVATGRARTPSGLLVASR
jgi:hypothetical protein